MLLSKFGAESLPQKKKSNFRIYFIISLLGLFLAGSYWIFLNYQRLIFNFKKDKYAVIISNINDIETSAKTNSINKENAAASEELLSGLIKDNPDDSYLYYLSGKLYYVETCDQILRDASKLTELLFLDYIRRYKFPIYISTEKWEKGIAHLRKALLLQLQEKDRENAVSLLNGMNLAGGASYWESAREHISTGQQNSLLANIYHLVFADSEPDWALFTKEYGEETTIMWIAIYNLKIKNFPIAFYNLKKLLLSENVTIRNSAYYLMGFLMGEQKNMGLKMYYHSLIEYEEFLRRNPWFLEEHNYTLRYMGDEAASRYFLGKYEKLVLELKEAL